MTLLGLMSGTSMDGLDCLLVNLTLTPEYHFEYELIDFQTIPYDGATKKIIRAALQEDDVARARAHSHLGKVFADSSLEFLQGRKVLAAGSHGQTVDHEDGVFTLQVGDPSPLAQALQAPVVHDFRTADIRAGGNGAPLVPFLDWLLFRNSNRDTITLNLGGVANISHIPPQADRMEVSGFDTGPGMGLIDEWVQMHWQCPMDKNGGFSKLGSVNESLLNELMTHPFIKKTPPKSTGRHEFGLEFLVEIQGHHTCLSPEDVLRTLVGFTAKSVSENIVKFLKLFGYTGQVILSGGGSHHPVLKADLEQYLHPIAVTNSLSVGLDPDCKEALLIATLTSARLNEIPANMPTVTGAKMNTILGNIELYYK